MTLGNGLMLEFDGEVDWPFPKRAVIMMKYLLGFKALFSPISHSLSAIATRCQLGIYLESRTCLQPEYQEG